MAKRYKKKKWYKRLRNEYRLVIFDNQTFEERFSFRLTRLNLMVSLFSLGIIFVTLTFFVIAYTPLKEYIPGYPNSDERIRLYHLAVRADSLLYTLKQREKYLENIKKIISGQEVGNEVVEPESSSKNYDTIHLRKSMEDSLLRAEFENQNMYSLYFTEAEQPVEISVSSIRNFNFFPPVRGIISAPFNAAQEHYGTDLVTAPNEAVKATLDGTVIYSGWTLETGNVIAIQSRFNLVSVYKHNSILLKKEGEYVKAGEPIAITGQSGELSTGPHLHFELWYNGTALDPEEYILFN
ncbi:MAG: M23 family metallopeptidase [Chlorobi bacterium]|nr:M23 family metallopeptidase [Chlorobiota bacterium]